MDLLKRRRKLAMKKTKIKIKDEDYNEILELLKLGITIEKAGTKIKEKAQNILSSLATYGVEVPNKRIERLVDEMHKSLKWVEKN
jgi:hypothetical protein